MTTWFQTQMGVGPGWFVSNTILILLIALPLMLAVAMLIYADRKIWAAMALRRGPNVVGPFGLLQSFADGLKVFLQETIIPTSANRGLFLLAPIITFTVALIVWAVVPFGPGMVLSDINVGLLYILAASSLGVYGVIMAGWSSNSKYPFYSALRAAAQMVSYEVSIGFVLISVVLWVGSFNMTAIVEAQRGHLWIVNGFGFNPLFLPMAVVFFISSLAETARAPFDLTEAESELVAGYQTEYSSMSFALFWLGEYANVILMCALNSILFWGGYLPPINWAPLYLVPGIFWLFAKILVFFFIFSWVKATVPRYRYDQLMRLGWKIFLPISLAWVVLVSGYLMLTRYGGKPETTRQSVAARFASLGATDVCPLRTEQAYHDQDFSSKAMLVYLHRSPGKGVVDVLYPPELAGKTHFTLRRSNGYGGNGLLTWIGVKRGEQLGLSIYDVIYDGFPSATFFLQSKSQPFLMGDCYSKSRLELVI